MSSDAVLQDIPEGTTIKCITDHPGFKPVCVEKWSLRMAAHKFGTKQSKDINKQERKKGEGDKSLCVSTSNKRMHYLHVKDYV